MAFLTTYDLDFGSTYHFGLEIKLNHILEYYSNDITDRFQGRGSVILPLCNRAYLFVAVLERF